MQTILLLKSLELPLIREAGTNPEVAGSAEISAIQFKKQGSGIFTNVFIDGYKNLGGKNAFAVLIQDAGTETAQVLTNKVKVSPILFRIQTILEIGAMRLLLLSQKRTLMITLLRKSL